MTQSLACSKGDHGMCMRRTCTCRCGHPDWIDDDERAALEARASAEWVQEIPAADFRTVPIAKVKIGTNVRVAITGLDELTESIRRLGILEPLVGCENPDGTIDILMGQRRFAAAKKAGLDAVPVAVRPRPSDRDRLLMQLAENLERADMTPIEEARALAELIDVGGLTQEQASRAINRSTFFVSTRLQLLDMPEVLQDALHTRQITPGVALSVPRKLFDDKKAVKTLDGSCTSNETLRSWAHAQTVRLAGTGTLKGGYQLMQPVSLPVEYVDLAQRAAEAAGKPMREWVRDAIESAAKRRGITLPERVRKVTTGTSKRRNS